MPVIQRKGAQSSQGFGEFAQSSTAANYIEDVFSTYLVKPTSSNTNYSVTNGIDVSGKGGMVWMKARDAGSTNNLVYDTARGASSISNNALITNSLSAQQTANFDYITGLSNGFTVNFATGGGQLTNNGINYVSWTFRKQAKFFDIVTYTGNGANRTISHNLGSVPGCIMIKRTDTSASWAVYHRSLANTEYLVLNTTDAKLTSATYWNSTTPTSTVFSVGTDARVNASGGTYVAYLFAHNAGGFGSAGTDNVISCGSFIDNGAGTSVNLGYEPQFLIVKGLNVSNWVMRDVMRDFSYNGNALLYPNSSTDEGAGTNAVVPTATGFQLNSYIEGAGVNIVYIAIRRGPMKTPTSGTSVLGLNARTGTGANATVTGGQNVDDAVLIKNRGSAVADLFSARLTGTGYLVTSTTAAEVAAGTTILQANPWDVMDGVKVGTTSTITNASGNTFINYLFKRAPGFFDVVCYTGGGSTTYIYNHNLGVVPELIIIKSRSNGANVNYWPVKIKSVLGQQPLALNSASENPISSTYWASADDTATQFSTKAAATAYDSNATGYTYVAYLFATVAGVSKVGSYTGTGALQTVNCGFTSGARFVLIKRTDSTGDWYVWDSARGISSANDPYFLLNSAAAEVTGTNYVDTDTTGFKVTAAAPVGINASGGSYIFLAIA